MWKNKHKKLSKRVLSAVAASAIAGSQIMTAIPYSTAAARTSKQINTVPDKVMWWGDETETPKYGDVNKDGMINAVDAGLIRSYINKETKEIDFAAADVNGDGEITERDAELIDMHYTLVSTGHKGLVFPYREADVYVTISDNKKQFGIVQELVNVTDIDEDGKLTIDDALVIAHEKFGGKSHIYQTESGNYGLAIKKLWGIENGGAFAYYLNDKIASSLYDEIESGDDLNAFVYSDITTYSDKYSFFDVKRGEDTESDSEVKLKLSYIEFDQSFAPVSKPLEGAKITVNGKETDAVTDADGNVTVKLTEKGKNIISAVSDTVNNVPPSYVVNVTDKKAAETTITTTATAATTAATTTTAVIAAGPAAGEAYDTQGLDPSKSPVKPILSLSRLRVPISEAQKNPDQTIELKVSGADGKYSATGLNIQYDVRLTIKKDGDNYAEKGDACKDLTVVQKSTGNGFYVGTVSSEDKGRDGTYMTFKLTVPADTKVGDKFPIEIAYYSDESRKGSFTNAKKDENGQLMEAWVFTQGVQQGYIEVVNDEVTTSPRRAAFPASDPVGR